MTDTHSTNTAEDWEAVAMGWIEYGEHQASYAAYLELQIQGHLDEIEELKAQNGKLTADNKRQAESIHAYRHRIDHLTFTDLPADEQHGITARIQRQAEQDLQEQLQKQKGRHWGQR